MADDVMIHNLSTGVRAAFAAPGPDPDRAIEQYLDQKLAGVGVEERLAILAELTRQFGDSPASVCPDGSATDSIHQLMSRFLGTPVGVAGHIPPQELAENFAGALNTLFDAVNQIVSVINVTLLGQSQELETIRKVIGANIQGEAEYAAIREYLERIKKSFLVSHQAFQQATSVVIDELLTELDPESLAKNQSSGLKFGPLRKADLFDQYEEKHARCKRWLQTDSYKEKLLREFERQCQRQFGGEQR